MSRGLNSRRCPVSRVQCPRSHSSSRQSSAMLLMIVSGAAPHSATRSSMRRSVRISGSNMRIGLTRAPSQAGLPSCRLAPIPAISMRRSFDTPHPEERAQHASRRMGKRTPFATLRDAPSALLRVRDDADSRDRIRHSIATSSLRSYVIAVGLCASLLFIIVGLAFQLQMFGDGSIFSYSVAAQDAWAFHWHNISVRLFSYLYAYVPAQSYVALTNSASAGIFIYGLLHFSAPLLGLLTTWAADRTA